MTRTRAWTRRAILSRLGAGTAALLGLAATAACRPGAPSLRAAASPPPLAATATAQPPTATPPVPTATSPPSTATPHPLPTATSLPTATATVEGQVSSLPGGRRQLVLTDEGLSVVYEPGSFAADHLSEFVVNWRAANAYVRVRLAVTGLAPMTVELRGDGAAAPLGLGVRGYSEPAAGRMYQLYDGSGDPGDRAYITAHELGHMLIYHKAGWDADTMLGEGIAMYASDEFLRRDGLTTIGEFAQAAQAAGRLIPLTALSTPNAAFHGRLVDRAAYDIAGAFVSWLIAQRGLASFLRVYPTARYADEYGMPLATLDAAWQGALRSQAKRQSLAFDPGLFFRYLDRAGQAYARLYAQARQHGDRLDPVAYREVDAARLAVDRHDYASAETHLRAVSG